MSGTEQTTTRFAGSPLAEEAVWPFREVLAELNCQQREVMERVFFGEMSLKEIAEETNQDLGAVRNHYYRGLKKLQSLLSKNANRDKKAALDKQLGAPMHDLDQEICAPAAIGHAARKSSRDEPE
jgi:predicted DNA-binding protein YlxM (UPF0122 family)